VRFSPARLRAWRHARNHDHAALADATGRSIAAVAACEAGQSDPTPGMVTAWSALLGCQPDQLCSATPADPGEYWQAANQAMPRMSAEDLAVVARIFTRGAGHVGRARPAGTD
jgi:transcriptional regulator with XRE-family HTH domain